MKALRFFAVLAMAALVLSCGQEKKTVLFNGENLDGWVAVTDPSDTTGNVVFSVEDGLLAISGNPFGYIRTEKAYGDYAAHLEFRWVGTEKNNSGFFQRVQEGDQVWPKAVECQLGAGNLGDMIGLGGAPLSGVESNGRFAMKKRLAEDSELPAGEWNVIDVECTGGHIKYTVNGVLQNEADTELTSGYIAIQSEGGPLQVRNIYIVEK